MLQGKWKLQILYELCIKSPMRFGELKKLLKPITNTALTNALKELEKDELVQRIQYNEMPLRVEYSLYERAALLFSEAGARMEEPEFTDQVTLRGILPEGDELPLLPKLTELTRGGRTLTVSQPFHTAF